MPSYAPLSHKPTQKERAGLVTGKSGAAVRRSNGVRSKGRAFSRWTLPASPSTDLGRAHGEIPYRERIERAFGAGHELSNVRSEVGSESEKVTEQLGAEAFTVGEQVRFRRYPSLWLAAHEAAHVVQQRAGRLPPDGIGRPGDALELQADRVADRVVGGRSVADLLPEANSALPVRRVALQAQYRSGTGARDPNAYVPIADLITYVEAVERAYPNDTPTDVLTRIRVQYYEGIAFEQLIPGANTHDTSFSSTPYGPAVASIPRRLSAVRIGREDPAAYQHLTARADENALGDNPSPYIVLPNGEQIDLGHLLLGMDALIHPTTSVPYSSYGVPNIDPSSWVADIGIASVWTTQHTEQRKPPSDSPVQPTSPDLNVYWAASAPEQDLLGDVDSFGVNGAFAPTSGRKLSQALRQYYLGAAAGSAAVQRRYRTFCSANGLGYQLSTASVTWDPSLSLRLVQRVNTFNDLYAAGRTGAAWGSVVGPSHRAWPFTPAVVDRFLAWLKPRLEAEIAAHP
jgi:hypothetical protein